MRIVVLWTCTGLFLLRVLGQLEVVLVAPTWLPTMEQWFSGLLPYPLLLPAQVLILMLMTGLTVNEMRRAGDAASPGVVASGFAGVLRDHGRATHGSVPERRGGRDRRRGYSSRVPLGAGAVSSGILAHHDESRTRAMTDVITMYRPTGPKELELLRLSGFRRWPPRLPEQPIFYPVTNEQYAIEIASRWNVRDDGVGYVTRFAVRSDFMSKYPVQRVGGEHHTEWWVPAEELEALNDNIVGLIEVIGEYRRSP
jgi:hypothetical protein